MRSIKLFFIATILFTMSANAQITKNNWLVGGAGTFDNTTVKDEDGSKLGKGYGFRVYPNIGYFLIDKMAAGLKLGFNYGKTEGNSSIVGGSMGPFVRYYFLNPDKRINVFAEANYNYYISKTQNFDTTNGYNYNFKAGPEIFFNSSVGLEFTVNYSYSNSNSSISNVISFEIGFQIHLEK